MLKKLFGWATKKEEPKKPIEENVEVDAVESGDIESSHNQEIEIESNHIIDENILEENDVEIKSDVDIIVEDSNEGASDLINDDTAVYDEINKSEIIYDEIIEEESIIEDVFEESKDEISIDVVKEEYLNEELESSNNESLNIQMNDENSLDLNNELGEYVTTKESEEVTTDEVMSEEVITEDVIQFEETKKEEANEGGFFARLKAGLNKTTKNFSEKISAMLECYEGVSEEVYEELEELLIMADVGFETTNYIIENLRDRVLEKSISHTSDVKIEIQSIIAEILSSQDSSMNIGNGPSIVTIVGVNGVGKTTTIGKLANKYRLNGEKVILAAADTFRAAAAEQLEIWAKRSNVEIVKHKEGADPSAVIFDGIKAAKARNATILICDTAGRLHNKKNLMLELGKIFRIIDREYEEANKEVLLVIDATTGQNAISQAKLFKEVAPITGIILTKLDGTAKGGVVIGILKELGLPIKYIGVGEKLDDLQEFSAESFARALFDN